MRKLSVWALAFAFIFCLPLSAWADGSFYGTVVCESPVTVRAPYGGAVSGIAVRPGDRIGEKTRICTIETAKVYAPEDGTVSAVFIRPGDSVESVKSLHTALICLISEEKYYVNASMQTASKKNAECYLSIGQTVYLESGAGRQLKTGVGYVADITAANAEIDMPMGYTIRVTEGDFFLDDKVSIYWTENRDKKTSLGAGTIEQTTPVSVSSDGGSILRVHVKPGDRVQRGTLLYETVAGDLDGLKSRSSEILSGIAGIVSASDLTDGAAIDKGASMITVYPLDRLQVCVTVSEPELKNFNVGNEVDLFFSQDEDARTGKIAAVSYLAETVENSTRSAYANYKVYIDFEADESVRLGMLVAVEIP